MIQLRPFSPIEELIEVRGSIQHADDKLIFYFELNDPKQAVLNNLKSAHWSQADLQRADGLWQTTCFEAFWSEKGQKSYWELNLSPHTPRWNIYFFNEYRNPQPPRPDMSFKLIEIQTTVTSLTCQLTGAFPTELDTNLSAVIKTNSGTYYFSSHHAGSKPDFHLREAFQ